MPIEDNIKKLCQGISNVMLVGDKRKFNVALVTLKAKGATGELPGGDELDGAALSLAEGVTTIARGTEAEGCNRGKAAFFATDSATFGANPLLAEEVFGSSSVLIRCSSIDEAKLVGAVLAISSVATPRG